MTSVSGHLRQQVILEQLHTYQHVRIKYLIAQLHVSYPTVVRDLRALEAQALVRRVHGGAVATGLGSATGRGWSPTGGFASRATVPGMPADRAIQAAVRATRVIREAGTRQPRTSSGTNR